MTLLHFDFDTAAPSRQNVPARDLFPAVEQTVTVTPLPSTSRTHLTSADAGWGWSELRDYVVTSIEARFGAFPRDARKESAIFKRFVATYGSDAPAIAKHAFEVCNGWWANAPISVNRFCKGSDAYFGDVILARLRDVAPATV